MNQMGAPMPITHVPAAVVACMTSPSMPRNAVPMRPRQAIVIRAIRMWTGPMLFKSCGLSGALTSRLSPSRLRKPQNSRETSLDAEVNVESSVDMEAVIMMKFTKTSNARNVWWPKITATSLASETVDEARLAQGFQLEGHSLVGFRPICPELQLHSLLKCSLANAPYTPMKEKKKMNAAAKPPPINMDINIVLGVPMKPRSVSTGSKNGYEMMP
mmetsp:Transcript_90514/g.180102  ORF Transcript_90514/g.180102 Transcript_90514/m.180102 type:complete len:215 (+) Transcript_90514:622-1266(+)